MASEELCHTGNNSSDKMQPFELGINLIETLGQYESLFYIFKPTNSNEVYSQILRPTEIRYSLCITENKMNIKQSYTGESFSYVSPVFWTSFFPKPVKYKFANDAVENLPSALISNFLSLSTYYFSDPSILSPLIKDIFRAYGYYYVVKSQNYLKNGYIIFECSLHPEHNQTKKTRVTGSSVKCQSTVTFHYNPICGQVCLTGTKISHNHHQNSYVAYKKVKLGLKQEEEIKKNATAGHKSSSINRICKIPPILWSKANRAANSHRFKVSLNFNPALFENNKSFKNFKFKTFYNQDGTFNSLFVINLLVLGSSFIHNSIIITDSTYNVLLDKKVIQVVLVEDPNQGYQIVGFAVLADESAQSLEIFLRYLKVHGLTDPRGVIIDRSPTEKAALIKIWSSIKFVFCKIHYVANLKKKAKDTLGFVEEFIYGRSSFDSFKKQLKEFYLKNPNLEEQYNYLKDFLKEKDSWSPGELIIKGLYELLFTTPAEGSFGNLKTNLGTNNHAVDINTFVESYLNLALLKLSNLITKGINVPKIFIQKKAEIVEWLDLIKIEFPLLKEELIPESILNDLSLYGIYHFHQSLANYYSTYISEEGKDPYQEIPKGAPLTSLIPNNFCPYCLFLKFRETDMTCPYVPCHHYIRELAENNTPINFENFNPLFFKAKGMINENNIKRFKTKILPNAASLPDVSKITKGLKKKKISEINKNCNPNELIRPQELKSLYFGKAPSQLSILSHK